MNQDAEEERRGGKAREGKAATNNSGHSQHRPGKKPATGEIEQRFAPSL